MNVCIRQKLPDETGLLFDRKGVDTKMAEIKSVFISYSSKNKELVHKIVRVLEHIGVSYWKAPDMIPVGSNYAREIPRAIRECDLFLLILSKESQESVWVEKEVDSAICYKKNIVPFKIDDTPMNDTFSFYLNNVQMIPYYLGEVAAVKSLCEQLQAYTAKASKHLWIRQKVSRQPQEKSHRLRTVAGQMTGWYRLSQNFARLKITPDSLDLWRAIRRKMFLEKSIPLVHGCVPRGYR